MKHFIFTGLFLFIIILSNAQIDLIPDNINDQQPTINPAYRPIDDNFELRASATTFGLRNLNSPQILSHFNIIKNIPEKGIGAGLSHHSVLSETLKRNSLLISGSYKVIFDKYELFFGLEGGFTRIFHQDHFGDPVHENDPFYNTERFNVTRITINSGLFLRSDKVTLGVSSRNLVQNENDISRKTVSIPRTFYITSEYRIKLSSDLEIIPSILLSASENNISRIRPKIEMSYKEGLSLGIQTDNVAFQGFSFSLAPHRLIPSFSERFKLWYQFSHPLAYNELSNFGSRNEIGIIYAFNLRPSYKKILNEKIIDSPTIIR